MKKFSEYTKEQKKSFYKFLIIFCSIIVVAVIVDQITKIIFHNIFETRTKPIRIIGDWLVLTFTTNPGGMGGLLAGKHTLFFIVTIVGLPLFVFLTFWTKKDTYLGAIGLAVVVGGIIGNAIDRAFLGTGFFNGHVRDFISAGEFPIFNIADSCITVGIIIYAIGILFVGPGAIFRKKEQAIDEKVESSEE